MLTQFHQGKYSQAPFEWLAMHRNQDGTSANWLNDLVLPVALIHSCLKYRVKEDSPNRKDLLNEHFLEQRWQNCLDHFLNSFELQPLNTAKPLEFTHPQSEPLLSQLNW
jgi:hypothetical protein